MTTYQQHDRFDSLSQTRSFVVSILFQAYRSGNELLAQEFEAKLEVIDKELNKLLAQ